MLRASTISKAFQVVTVCLVYLGLVSWGRRGGPEGSNMAFNYGNHELFTDLQLQRYIQ